MKTKLNPWRGREFPGLDGVPFPSVNAERPERMLERCPRAGSTPLVRLGDAGGVGELWVKDERARMGLGSFKALGAAYVVARDAAEGQAAGRVYVTASAGNHGLSVAAGASAFGAGAVVVIAETVPDGFARRLEDLGAEVIRAGSDYAASMARAEAEAEKRPGAVLLSDSSWAGYTQRPHILMEGYLVLMAEVVRQITAPPTHILLQAGVGGLAGTVAAMARAVWGDAPRIAVVEPEVAPALFASIEAGRAIETEGPDSCMGRLDCKAPSLIALKGLARDADDFVLISEGEANAGADRARAAGLASTPSGAAGLAALFEAGPADREALGLSETSRVLAILSEAPE